MIDWTTIKKKKDLTPAVLDEIRIALLKYAKARGSRMYALFVVVLMLGIPNGSVGDVQIQFLPSIEGGLDWVLIYEGAALNMTPDVHAVVDDYINKEPRFEPYTTKRNLSNGAVLPLFVSECHRMPGTRLKDVIGLFRQALQRIGYDGTWLYLSWIALRRA